MSGELEVFKERYKEEKTAHKVYEKEYEKVSNRLEKYISKSQNKKLSRPATKQGKFMNGVKKILSQRTINRPVFNSPKLHVTINERKPATYINNYFSEEFENEGNISPFKSVRGLFWA